MSMPLTEAEIDAANAASAEFIRTLSAGADEANFAPVRWGDGADTQPLDYAGCSGHCLQGRRACDCGRDGAPLGMWDDERAHPWGLLLLYAATLGAVALLSLLFPGPWWGPR